MDWKVYNACQDPVWTKGGLFQAWPKSFYYNAQRSEFIAMADLQHKAIAKFLNIFYQAFAGLCQGHKNFDWAHVQDSGILQELDPRTLLESDWDLQ